LSQFGNYPAPRVIPPPPKATWQTLLTGWALAVGGAVIVIWLSDLNHAAAWRAFDKGLSRLPNGLWCFDGSAADLWLLMVGLLAFIITTTAFGTDWSKGSNWTLYRWFPEARWKIAGGCAATVALLLALAFAFPETGGLATDDGVVWLSRGEAFEHRKWSEARDAEMSCEMVTPSRSRRNRDPFPIFTFEVRFAGGRRANLTYLFDRSDDNFGVWLYYAARAAARLEAEAPAVFRRRIDDACYDRMISGLSPDLARRFGRLMAPDRF
jgi:hypothetical protein